MGKSNLPHLLEKISNLYLESKTCETSPLITLESGSLKEGLVVWCRQDFAQPQAMENSDHAV
jgi:hypothetical protein